MIGVCFLFFFMVSVIMKLQRLRTRERAAHCMSVDQKERKKQQRTELELQQHAAQHMHRNYSNAQGKFESKSVYLHTVFLYQYACQHFVQPTPDQLLGPLQMRLDLFPKAPDNVMFSSLCTFWERTKNRVPIILVT